MIDILKEIDLCEKESRLLEPERPVLKTWNDATSEYALDFVDHLDEGNAFEQWNGEAFDFSDIPEEGQDIKGLLKILKSSVDHYGINPASGGHLGYIPGGGIYPTALGDYLAAVTNRYAGVFYANPAAVRMENDMIKWTALQMGYPANSGGNLSSGGSLANLMAITTARDAKGIQGASIEKAVVYMTEQVHHCVHKALRIAGLGASKWRNIPLDKDFRMDVSVLAEQLEADRKAGLQPFMIVGSAGTTDTGAVDPLDTMADLSEEYSCWFHVDGAYGAAFKFVPYFDRLFSGIERSDSLVMDPHKGMFMAYGLGIVLIKNVEAMAESHHYNANYMQDAKEASGQNWSPADLSPELTKHFRGLRMWLSLQLFGMRPFRAALMEKHLLCKYFWQRLGEEGFERGPEPALSVCIYRFVPPGRDADTFNQDLMKRVLADGYNFISSTKINGQFWLRIAVLSFRTHRDRIEHLLNTMISAKEDLLS